MIRRPAYAFLLILIGFLFPEYGHSQSMYFGIKGGPTLTFQKWNAAQESTPTLVYHLMAHLESYGSQSAFFLNAGINPKGRSIRYYDYVNTSNGKVIKGGYARVVFRNAEMLAGVKRYYDWTDLFEVFYSFGLRLSYTYGTEFGQINYINENGVRRWNYGVSAGGGIRLKSNEFFRPLLHITFSPDLSNQILIPPQQVQSPTGDRYTTTKQEIRNIGLEAGITLQFLRKVVYK